MAPTARTPFFPLVLAFVLPLLAGCLDVNTSTVVHEDGSLLRTVEVQGDSGMLANGRYGIRLDSTWTKSVHGSGGSKPILKAVKRYRNAEEMTRDLDRKDGTTIAIHAELVTHFRWFTSTMEYRETWRKLHTFNDAPALDSLRREAVVAALLRGREEGAKGYDADSAFRAASGAGSMDSLLERNTREAFYRIFSDGMLAAGVDADTLRVRKEEVLSHLDAGSSGKDSLTVDDLRTRMHDLFPAPFVDRAFVERREDFERFVRMWTLRAITGFCDYTVRVTMPGIVTATNAPAIIGNTATWREMTDLADVQDVEMRVSSRVVNWWAVIVTAVVVFGGLAMILLAALYRKKRLPGSPLSAS
ncbi:MAG: hypothetical protein IPP94_01850 [Ignavibacteria bacterium]|nr:hypothetical protein [Ignavibacteria bacterium]